MDLGAIKQKIDEDKLKTTNSYRRYPVRFLFMELSNNTQNEILELVKGCNGELLELSDFIMKKDDGWLTKSRFIQVIKNNVSEKKDTFVVGFSEMIRFYSKKEIESTVLSLFDIENSNLMDEKCASRRVYFICFSMIDNVHKVLQNSFHRKDLIDPFINSEFELSGKYRQICFVSDEYSNNIKTNRVTTSVEWIGLWKNSEILDFSKPIWCCSASLFAWHQKASPDNAFQIDFVTNTKEYLQKVLLQDIKFKFIEEDDMFWKRLLSVFECETGISSFKQLIEKTLGVNAGQTYSLAAKMITSNDLYEKWVIKNYVLSYMSETYMAHVLNHVLSNTNREILNTLWIQGYKISHAGMLQERLQIIRELNKYSDFFVPEEELRNEIVEGLSSELCVKISLEEFQNGINIVELCQMSGKTYDEMKYRFLAYYNKIFRPAYSGISNTEKEYLINLYSNGLLDKAELYEIYPAFYAYLFGQGENAVNGNDEYKIYLDNYRQSKVRNADTPYLSEYYSSGCANAATLYQMYYSMNKQDVLLQKKSDNADVYVLDGVGAEYIPIIADLLKENGYEIEECEYATAHLPSITDVNKAYLKNNNLKRWILEFDRKVIHGEIYRTANNLRKAFDILSKIICDITSESCGKRIVITADHGATARARWTDTKKKYDFADSDHEGRCCKLPFDGLLEDCDDYIVYEDEINPGAKYAISLNDTSLFNKPKYEDHGGATLEELLVPVIVAAPQGTKKKTSYKVIDEKLTVSGLDKKVKFSIIPECTGAMLIDGDNVKHYLNNVGGIYQAELTSGRAQKITVVIEDNEYKFDVVNNAKKNMEGDDGFDD